MAKSTEKKSTAPATRKNKGNKPAQKKSIKKVLIIIAVIVLSVFLLLAALGIAFLATDGFGGRVNTLKIEIEGKSFAGNADGLLIYPDTEIKVKSLAKNPYEVRIEVNDKSDFEFTVAGESGYYWKHLAGKDFTKYFEITAASSSFTIVHKGINGVLKSYYGSDAVTKEEITPGDLFTLIVTCGSRERRFGFFPALKRPTDVTLNPDQIIM